MLTGDNIDTAITCAFKCKMIPEAMPVLKSKIIENHLKWENFESGDFI